MRCDVTNDGNMLVYYNSILLLPFSLFYKLQPAQTSPALDGSETSAQTLSALKGTLIREAGGEGNADEDCRGHELSSRQVASYLGFQENLASSLAVVAIDYSFVSVTFPSKAWQKNWHMMTMKD